ncbi:MerR family transcriptional regulator [Clostridium oryzae]|uniref:Multidrug-efflux transporter 1 regulator n=1 Tax=Clostridium oryzae TaxID=1450648 RepID=A0A1V4IZ57_9CLOT|nr:helix-turn-helix domain-containing protein [Clostridium oryzae]OPJ65206.1 multidrug-efflux transporter 1 regulator [Clostridium oryzae]
MYSIGQFSVMFQLNKKTLRYYDDIGLFKPAFVDNNNQYRYYKEEQIAVMKEIIRLKDIGIPLDLISKILNSQEDTQITECYDIRLREIEEAQSLLEKQKQLILNYKKQSEYITDKPSFNIEKGYFIEKGFVYYMSINSGMEDIQKNIGLFYENAKGIYLKGSHIFKMNIDENSDSISEIFAYTINEDNDRVRNQVRELCIKVECEEMKLKAEGYQALFEYAEKNSLSIKNIYEKYKMEKGKMSLTILTSIE